MHVYISLQGQKAVLTIAEFEFVDMNYAISNFSLYRHFSFADNFIFVLETGFLAVTWAQMSNLFKWM